MEPSCSLTWPAADRILRANGLGPLRELQPLAGGQINAVYLLNGEFVLRLRPAGKSADAFHTEVALLERLRGRVPVPEVVAVDDSREQVDADLILLRRLPGESLTRAWLRASPPKQERLVAAFAGLLRLLHAERFPGCGGFTAGQLRAAPSWPAYFAERFERRLRILRGFPNADRALLQAVETTWRRRAAVLAEGAAPGVLSPQRAPSVPSSLVHRDLHFGNVLVEGDRITGVLDFEAAVAGPPDYDLDQIGRFLRYPQLFVEPVLEAASTRARFAPVAPLLRRLYPELFATPGLADRLTLYSLEYDLAALRDCYAGRWGAAAHAHVVRRLATALQARSPADFGF